MPDIEKIIKDCYLINPIWIFKDTRNNLGKRTYLPLSLLWRNRKGLMEQLHIPTLEIFGYPVF